MFTSSIKQLDKKAKSLHVPSESEVGTKPESPERMHYCFNGLCFWMQQPAVIVLYVHGNTLESRMKATGYDFSLIVQLHLVSYGETLHICKRKLFIPLGEA